MDVHIAVDPTMSVSAAHQIAERTRIRVRQRLPMVAEFSVHVDVAQHMHALSHSVWESMPEGTIGPDQMQADQWQGDWSAGAHIIDARHIADVLAEHEATRAQTAMLEKPAAKGIDPPYPSHPGSAPPRATPASADDTAAAAAGVSGVPVSAGTGATSAPPSAPQSAAAKLAHSLKSLMDHSPSEEAVAASAAAAAAGSHPTASSAAAASVPSPSAPPSPDALDRLMRPQSGIEKDVRNVLSGSHQLWAPHLRGVSHFKCYWLDQRLSVQLDLAFNTDLTISQASTLAKAMTDAIKAQVHDVHQVSNKETTITDRDDDAPSDSSAHAL